jgi:uncharacterized protein (TIGR00251 family)
MPESSGDWIRPSSNRIIVEVKAVPGASRSEVAGLRDGALLVRVAAPPERGKANEELRACLAKALGLPKSAVELAAGAGARRKRLSLPAEAEDALRALASGGRGGS